MSGVVQAAAHRVPAGTPVVVYACLPLAARVPREPGRALRDVLRYVDERGWVPVGTFVDHAAVLSSRADRPEWPKALAAVEEGRAKGIVAPSMVTLWFHQEDRESPRGLAGQDRCVHLDPGSSLGPAPDDRRRFPVRTDHDHRGTAMTTTGLLLTIGLNVAFGALVLFGSKCRCR
ncbi:hypothetical protein DDQ41_12375 [Streptomyces spongiicola]|uniref:Resolvase/invertase-type recombinase catalytic domain-containing protein n=1 Tax=Streptomyces spongiicola TaxID=1690221 RepID=A0ABN5KGX1_9ACTN|nr:recombinase family protein [Streptomyces spongiicola]AWK09584.1 hypothetical protein DDQ41_12375 [Streptomyces spongiicola]